MNARRCNLSLLLLLLCLPACSNSADELRDFASDGCSSFPDGTRKQKNLWHACCVVHDLAYWKGGSSKERKESDEVLRACVAAMGEPRTAKLMLAGVRVGGTPWLPTRFRWAYGWPYLRGYEEISTDEEQMVAEKLRAAQVLLRAEGVLPGDVGDAKEFTESRESPQQEDEG